MSNRGIGRFIGKPQLEILDAPCGKVRARYLGGLVYVAHDGRSVVPRVGLVYDGASIPDPLWIKLGPPLCWSNIFGLPHDDMYRFGSVVDRDGVVRPVTRQEADAYARDMALAAGHSARSAGEILAGLRIGGGFAWKANESKRRECGTDVARLLAWC